MADHEELYDDARAERLKALLRRVADLIHQLDRNDVLLASSAELQRLLGEARSELFHYEVRSTYDTPEIAEHRRLVDDALNNSFTLEDPEDEEPWRTEAVLSRARRGGGNWPRCDAVHVPEDGREHPGRRGHHGE